MSTEGMIYDQEGPEVVDRITTFMKTYDISFKELLIQDPKGYRYVASIVRSFLLTIPS